MRGASLIASRFQPLLCRQPADAIRAPGRARLHILAAEAACRVVDRCVQTMGRWGLIRGSKIEKYYRQARPMRVYEGASEVLRLGIAARLVREVD